MSQAIEHSGSTSPDRKLNEFNYRPVPPLAPISLVLGICSVSGLVSPLGLIVGLLGVSLGALALWMILKANGELGGRTLALIGFVLSTLLFISGGVLHSYNYATEVPEGHRRISFNQEISKKEFVFENGEIDFHPDVKKLNGQNIFLKGFMYPVRETEDLTEFVFVKDSEKCCFGGQPKQTDMILVNMKASLTADYIEGRVAIAGVFKTELPQRFRDYGIASTPVYQMEAVYVSKSKSAF